MRVCCLCALLVLLVVGIAGCGGGSGSSGPRYVTAQVQVSWAERARGIGGPESALSVSFWFSVDGQSGQNSSFYENRLSAPAAYTQTYSSPAKVALGPQSLQVNFYASAGGEGQQVGSQTIKIIVKSDGALTNADGSPLGQIQVSTFVTGVLLSPPNIIVGQGTYPQVLVTQGEGDSSSVQVSPSSVFYQITPGTGSATVNSLGQIVGVTPGTITLTATVDGVTSPPVSCIVLSPPLQTSQLKQGVNQMVLDPQTGHFWVSVPASASSYANSVIEIDPASEKVLSSIVVGGNPDALAISNDGSTMYVGLDKTAQIARINLTEQTVFSTFNVAAPTGSMAPYAATIAIEPGNPDVISVGEQDTGDSGFVGGCIYSNGTLLHNCFGVYSGLTSAFTSATSLWAGTTGADPPTLYFGVVNSTGAILVNTYTSYGGGFKEAGGNLYLLNGQIVSGTSGSVLGTCNLGLLPAESNDLAPDAASGRVFFMGDFVGTSVGSYAQLLSFDTSSYQLVASAALPAPPNGQIRCLTRWGATGLAWTDGSTVYFTTQTPGLSPSARRAVNRAKATHKK